MSNRRKKTLYTQETNMRKKKTYAMKKGGKVVRKAKGGAIKKRMMAKGGPIKK